MTEATETAAEAVEFGAERVESARAIVEAERVMPTDFAHNAALHFAKALRKHPRFADALFNDYEKYCYSEEEALVIAEDDLKDERNNISVMEKNSHIDVWSLLSCEFLDAYVEHLKGDKAACVDELYDAVAVLMRMIAVVEGKQKLGGEK